MSPVIPVFGIGSQIEVDLDARLPNDPLQFVADASKAGLFVQLFIRNGKLWARLVGELDPILDFQASL